jgi:hypothetical protein
MVCFPDPNRMPPISSAASEVAACRRRDAPRRGEGPTLGRRLYLALIVILVVIIVVIVTPEIAAAEEECGHRCQEQQQETLLIGVE